MYLTMPAIHHNITYIISKCGIGAVAGSADLHNLSMLYEALLIGQLQKKSSNMPPTVDAGFEKAEATGIVQG